MTNLLYSLKNSELSQVAVELGECVPPGLHKKGLIDLIQNSTSYEVQLIQSILIDITEEREERLRIEAREREERLRLRTEAREREKRQWEEWMRLRNAEWERQDRLIAAERELILKNLRLKIELENRKKGIKMVATNDIKDVPLKSDLDIPKDNIVSEDTTRNCEMESSNTCENVSTSICEEKSSSNLEENKIICSDNQQSKNMDFIDWVVEPKKEIKVDNLICVSKIVDLNLGSSRDIFLDEKIDSKINLALLNVQENSSCRKIVLDETPPQNGCRDSEFPREGARPPITTLTVTPGGKTKDLEEVDSISDTKVVPYCLEKLKLDNANLTVVPNELSCFKGPIVGDELLTGPGFPVLQKDAPSCVLKRLGMGQLKGPEIQVRRKGRNERSVIVVVAVIPGIVKRRKSGLFCLILLGGSGDLSRKETDGNCQNFWNPEWKDIIVMGILGFPMGIG